MRITVVAGQFPRRDDWDAVRTVEALVHAGHDVVVDSVNRPGPAAAGGRGALPRTLHGRVRYPGREILRSPAGLLRKEDLDRFGRNLREQVGQGAKTRFFLGAAATDEGPPEAVLCLGASSHATVARELARSFRCPLTLQPQADDLAVGWQSRRLAAAAAVADRTVATSRHMAGRLRRLIGSGGKRGRRIVLLPPGVPIHPLPRRPAAARRGPGKQARLLCVGRLVRRKGFDDAVRAVAAIRDRGSEARLDVVGDGPERYRLELLAEALGVRHETVFHGALPATALHVLLREAGALVHPARAGEDGTEEGIPVPVLEAMAAGIPVVARPAGGLPEVVTNGRTGFVARPGTAGLVKAVTDALSHAGRVTGPAHRLVSKEHEVARRSRKLADILHG